MLKQLIAQAEKLNKRWYCGSIEKKSNGEFRNVFLRSVLEATESLILFTWLVARLDKYKDSWVKSESVVAINLKQWSIHYKKGERRLGINLIEGNPQRGVGDTIQMYVSIDGKQSVVYRFVWQHDKWYVLWEIPKLINILKEVKPKCSVCGKEVDEEVVRLAELGNVPLVCSDVCAELIEVPQDVRDAIYAFRDSVCSGSPSVAYKKYIDMCSKIK